MSGSGADPPPRQQQQRHRADQHRAAQRVIRAAPAGAVDEDLRERNKQQDACAGRGRNHRQRGRQPRAEPAADQQRTRHLTEARAAEAHRKADAELKLPELLREGGG